MTLRNDLRYIVNVLDRGGPKGPAEMSQVIVVVRRLSERIDELEKEVLNSSDDSALEELRQMHASLVNTVKTLEDELAAQKQENRTLKGRITRLNKKVQDESTTS